MNTNGQKTANQHMIRLKFFSIKTWVEAYIRDCKVRGLSPFTIEYYQRQLSDFTKFCNQNDVNEVEQITADLVRTYLLQLESTGHNAGGRHAKYRALRAFLNWWQEETEAAQNPIAKVKPPKVAPELIEGAKREDVKAILATCGSDFTGTRDKALILCLLDTGARARETLSVDLEDIDLITGATIVRKTKNKEPRVVFIGRKARRAVRAYLKLRNDNSPALWVTSTGERFAVSSLQSMLQQRGKLANIKNPPSAHDFRRYFVLTMLRAGVDVITLSRLTGHKTLDELKKYAKQTTEDLRIAHDKASPVDGML